MKVQVVGLPGSGKTSILNSFINTNKYILVLDVVNYQHYGNSKYKIFAEEFKNIKNNVIAESACGVLVPSKVIYYKPDFKTTCQRFKNREGWLDETYFRTLQQMIIKPDITVYTPNELINELRNSFSFEIQI